MAGWVGVYRLFAAFALWFIVVDFKLEPAVHQCYLSVKVEVPSNYPMPPRTSLKTGGYQPAVRLQGRSCF